MELWTHKTLKPQTKGSKQLFDNPILEKLTRTHISIPIIILDSVSIGLLVWGILNTSLSIITIGSLFVAGLLTFTLVEYLVHRYFFHIEPDTERKAKIQYTVHGVHHEFPKDKERLAMPPILSAAISAILFFGFRALIGEYVFAFLPGFIIGYSLYLVVHYVVHAFQPPKNFLKILWIHHGIHHYKDPDRAFGVSSPLWDVIFRTMPK